MKTSAPRSLLSEPNDFLVWLMTAKHFSQRSAGDVVSRSKRVAKMLSVARLTAFDESDLTGCRSFGRLSYTVKSQLKRAARLAVEYANQSRASRQKTKSNRSK